MLNKKIVSKFFSLCIIVLLIWGCQSKETEMAAPVKDGVLIHVSNGANDPHRVLMALKMAEIMAEDKDVLIYFDIKGVEVVLKDAVDLQFSHFPSSQTQLKTLIEKGVQLSVCPGCLKAAGKIPADVMAGVKIAEKQAFFNFTNGRILTLDY